MPFKSKAQARAAFSGALGPAMRSKARQWAYETPGGIRSLPPHVRPPRKPTGRHPKTVSR
jgi:hypothetical protein